MNTPRTDALLKDAGNDPHETGWIEHARQLETELAAVKADYQKNDEQWIARENELMAKLEKCRTALESAHRGCGDFDTEPLDENGGDQRERGEMIKKTLEETK